MIIGLIVVIALLLAGTGFGLWRRRVDGRLHDAHRTGASVDEETLSADEIGAELGSTATLLQFSSAFCQPCRATRTLLTQIADTTPGVVTVDIDAEHHLDLVRRLHVMRTPTVLVLDAAGVIHTRASGLPRKDELLSAIHALA